MLKPSTFDASRKYPVIVFVYGEPAGQMVTDRWGGVNILFHRALAEAGYVVVCFDNRGTPSPRGAAWRKVIYGTVGDLSSKDQAAAIRAIAATVSLHRRRSTGHLGLERRRIEHAERDVPVPRPLQGRRLGCAGSRSAALRHDLSGALHGAAARQRRRLPDRIADQFRGGPEGKAADRPRVGRRQRALSGHGTAGQPARSSWASRST